MLNDPSAPIPFNSNSNIRFQQPQEESRTPLNQNSALEAKAQSNTNLQFQKSAVPLNDYSSPDLNSYSQTNLKMASQKWKNENSTAHLQNSNVNKAFRGYANVAGPATHASEKRLSNQIFIPNASADDMRILNQKSPRDNVSRILPAQL